MKIHEDKSTPNQSIVSINRDAAPLVGPAIRYEHCVQTSIHFQLATVEAARQSLATFEMRFRHCHELAGVLDVIKTARKVADETAIKTRRLTIRPV